MANRPKPHVHGRDHEHGGADPQRIHYEDVGDSGGGGGGGGGEIPSFTLTGGVWTLTDAPVVLDSDALGSVPHFATTDAATFAMSGSGRAQILVPGLYVIGCQLDVDPASAVSGDTFVSLRLAYESDIGYGIETPWMDGGLFGGDEIKGTRHVYPDGTGSAVDIGLQRIHPISLTSSTTFPLDIEPTFNTNADSMRLRSLGLWGFRIGGPLDSWHSD